MVSFVGIENLLLYSPVINCMKQARREMAEVKHFQRCAHEIFKATKAGNTSTVNILFGVLDNKHDIEDILCMCQEYLQLVYTTPKVKPTIFARINNAELVKDLTEQNRWVCPD